MDCAPLNLAHFHERRADKFLRHHRYDDAFKATEMSLLYLQDAYKSVRIAKSIEVLDTQKWDLERKLKQIQLRKQQYERAKLKEILPLKKETISILRPENSVTAQSVAKSIDKTIRDFDAKFSLAYDHAASNKSLPQKQVNMSKENQDPKTDAITSMPGQDDNRIKMIAIKQSEQHRRVSAMGIHKCSSGATQSANSVPNVVDYEDLPALVPLELPAFDFDLFTSSAPSLTSITGLAESFQK